MISFDEALACLRAFVSPLGSETVALAGASHRWLAEDIVSRIASPRHTVSAMDGYAVIERGISVGKAVPVVGEARPGHAFDDQLGIGAAVRIFTGAPLPEGADCVIMQEYAEREGDEVRFREGHGPSRHVRERASDFDAGTVLVPAGRRLDPQALVAAAAADVGAVRVHRRPQIALVATGDELAEPGKAMDSPRAIPDSVTHALAALIERQGGAVGTRHRAVDDLPALEQLAGDLLASADLVVVTGGASVGERDFAKPMFVAHGLELAFDTVAIKPGKPVWLGRAGGTLVMGLPGNPTSAMVTARLLLVPLLARLQGGDGAHRWRNLPLAATLGATGGRETFARACWGDAGLVPIGNQDSGVQGGLARADWLIRCPPGQAELRAGTVVPALAF